MTTTISLSNAGGVTFEGTMSPGALFLRGPFPFTFATNGLTAGVPLFTPAVGDVIYDIGVSIPVAFDGTTPMADIGTFNGSSDGLFASIGTAAIDLTTADVTRVAGLAGPQGLNWYSANILTEAIAPWQLYVTAANPLLLVVSQTGAKGGAATGATAGSGNVYVLTGTPSG